MVGEHSAKKDNELWSKYFFDAAPKAAIDSFPAQGLVRIFRGAYPLLPSIPDSGTAADVGCGDGRNTRFLKQQGFEVVGVETDEGHVGHLRRHQPETKFLTGSCANIPLPTDSINVTVAWNSCYYMDYSDVTLTDHISELYRITKAGGLIVVSMPMPTSFIFSGVVHEETKADSPLGVKYLIVEDDPFLLRNGQILATYGTAAHLKRNVSALGNIDVTVSSEEGDWFGYRYDWWVWTAVKQPF